MSKTHIPEQTKVQCDCCGRFTQPHGIAEGIFKAEVHFVRYEADGAGHRNLKRGNTWDLCDRCSDVVTDAFAKICQERHEFFAGETA
jgi:hypothetical protein